MPVIYWIMQILNGQGAVTGNAARRLGRFFGASGELWLNEQKLYANRPAECEHGAEIAPAVARGRRRRPKGAAVYIAQIAPRTSGGALLAIRRLLPESSKIRETTPSSALSSLTESWYEFSNCSFGLFVVEACA